MPEMVALIRVRLMIFEQWCKGEFRLFLDEIFLVIFCSISIVHVVLIFMLYITKNIYFKKSKFTFAPLYKVNKADTSVLKL